MKILCLIDSLDSGGAQRQLVTLAKLLKQRNNTVTFLTYAKGEFFLNDLLTENIECVHIATNSHLLRILKVRHFIRKGAFNTVVSFLDTPNFLNCFSAIGGKKWKVIAAERSSKDYLFVTARGKLFAWFLRYSDQIVCNSKHAEELWRRFHPEYTNKLTTIYNTVLLPKVTFAKYIPKKNGRLHIVIAASYQYLKNPIRVVEAVSQLDENQKNKIRIDWFGRKEATAGNFDAYNETVRMVDKNNLKDIFFLHEETKKIANVLHGSDIVALFSELEGLPNVICEALTLGKPIIMTKVSDYNTLVDSANGLLCDWKDTDSIKETLIQAIDLTSHQLKKMGENSKKKAGILFDKDTILKEWLAVIK